MKNPRRRSDRNASAFFAYMSMLEENSGCIWMSILEGLVLNWVQYQFTHGIEMGRNSNSNVWMAITFCFGICSSILSLPSTALLGHGAPSQSELLLHPWIEGRAPARRRRGASPRSHPDPPPKEHRDVAVRPAGGVRVPWRSLPAG